MKKATLALATSFVLGVIFCAMLWRRGEFLRAQNQSLGNKVAELEEATAQARRAASAAESGQAEAQAHTLELMRLRGEVTQLRATIAQNRSDLKHLGRGLEPAVGQDSAPAAPAAPMQGERIAREDWRFMGFETPEATFHSKMWAIKEGRMEAYLSTLTPEERQRFEAQNQNRSKDEIVALIQRTYANVTGLRVMGHKETAPDEVVLDVYLEGAGTMKKYRMNQAGNEWKAGGLATQNRPVAQADQENGAYDPLAFYRRNPELMKRYFPHLARAGGAIQEPATPAADGE